MAWITRGWCTVENFVARHFSTVSKKGSFARSYPLSRRRVDGVVRAEGKLLQLAGVCGSRARACVLDTNFTRNRAIHNQALG